MMRDLAHKNVTSRCHGPATDPNLTVGSLTSGGGAQVARRHQVTGHGSSLIVLKGEHYRRREAILARRIGLPWAA